MYGPNNYSIAGEDVRVNPYQLKMTWALLNRKPIIRAALKIIMDNIFCGPIELTIEDSDGKTIERMSPRFKRDFDKFWVPFLKSAIMHRLCFGFIPYKHKVDTKIGLKYPLAMNPGTYDIIKRTTPDLHKYSFLPHVNGN